MISDFGFRISDFPPPTRLTAAVFWISKLETQNSKLAVSEEHDENRLGRALC
jgi:hypothetical protein